MNNPNPFVPQGSLLEQQNKRRSRIKVGVFCVLAVGIVGLTTMLIQGCKREQTETENQPSLETNETAMNTNLPPAVEASNPPVLLPPAMTPPPVAPPETGAAATEYVVVKGDSFSKIAKKFGVSVKAIKAMNPGVEPTKLKVGQKLSIPASSGGTAAPAAASALTPTGSSMGEETYTVKSGDTLTKIAKAHGTTVKAIESENNLSTTKIKVGQKLKIPAKAEVAAPVSAPVAPAPVLPQGTTPAPAGQ
ncbi:MAG: LysM peptidoglycan-binding domain-containing protein [Verrucomicrobiota bacterium]|jgi:LysM repeat protein